MYQKSSYLIHYGTKGQKWGVRKYQNLDGSLTALGRSHYGYGNGITRNGSSTNPYNLRIAGQGSTSGTTKSNSSTHYTINVNGTTITGTGAVDDSKKKEVEANGKWKPIDLDSGARIQTYEYGGRMYISDEDGQFMLDVGSSSRITYDYLKNTLAPMFNEANKTRTSERKQAQQDLKLGNITKEQYDKLIDQIDANYARGLANSVNLYSRYAPDTNSVSYKLNTTVSSLVSSISSLSKTAASTINKVASKTVSSLSSNLTTALNWLKKKF